MDNLLNLLDGYNKQAIIKELENLKADIECDKKMFFYDEGMQKAYANSIEIINSHIAKIKGENK